MATIVLTTYLNSFGWMKVETMKFVHKGQIYNNDDNNNNNNNNDNTVKSLI